jgi:hypothetical protein
MENSSKDVSGIVRDLFREREIDTLLDYGNLVQNSSANCYSEFFIRN